jgi:hypothetical protein
VVAVCPLIAGRAVKGPLVEMLRSIDDLPPTPEGIAACYGRWLDGMLIHPGDEAPRRPASRVEPLLLATTEDRVRIARSILAFGGALRR